MDTVCRQICSKIEAARGLVKRLADAGLTEARQGEALLVALDSIEMRYVLLTAHLFINTPVGEEARARRAADFSRIVARENFAGDIDDVVDRAAATLRPPPPAPAARGRRKAAAALPQPRGTIPATALGGEAALEIQRALDMYPRGRALAAGAAGAALHVDYEACPGCGTRMETDASLSELRCPACGAVQELVGMVFDDSQFYRQEGQKAKSGTFNPNRHWQFWMTHLSAREPEEEIGDKDDPDNLYGEKLIEELRRLVVQDGRVLRLLTVDDVRSMLRRVGKTKLNQNVALIMKKLTGVGPPQLPEEIEVLAENYFTKVIEISENVSTRGRVNRNYYPYYILKILDHILPENDLVNRRLLYYIYIQSKDTVEGDDADWERICQEVDIVYRPTDRLKMRKYRPI